MPTGTTFTYEEAVRYSKPAPDRKDSYHGYPAKFGKLSPLFYGDYKGKSIIFCKCDCGSIITQKYCRLLSGRSTSCGCGKRDKLDLANHKKFLEKHADTINKYDIDIPFSQWKDDKITYYCPVHKEHMDIKKFNIRRGQPCGKCGKDAAAKKRHKSTLDFINDARSVHGDTYDYFTTHYTGSREHLSITCPEHGEFSQLAYEHLRGSGCNLCACTDRGLASRLCPDEYKSRVEAIFGDKYDLSTLTYTLATENVTLVCPKHGEFDKTPSVLLRGSGCPQCYEGSVGYQKGLPGVFYITRWYGDGIEFLKFGITNQNAERRAKSQASQSTLRYEVLQEFSYEDGAVPASIERKCMMMLDTHYCPKDLLPDGYTETVRISDLSVILQQVTYN